MWYVYVMKFLQGYKTYLTAIAAITGALASVASGSIDLGDAVQLIVAAVLAVTLRAGIKSETSGEDK